MSPNNDMSILFSTFYNPNWPGILNYVVSIPPWIYAAHQPDPNGNLQRENCSVFKHKMIENGQSKTKQKKNPEDGAQNKKDP